MAHDPVNSPSHYNSHPSGIETIQVTEHLSAMIGSGVKYVWRRNGKGNPIQDLEKVAWCFRREAKRIREFEDAALWDGDYWRWAAGKVVAHAIDETLNAVLDILLETDEHGEAAALACDQLAKVCENGVARLKEIG